MSRRASLVCVAVLALASACAPRSAARGTSPAVTSSAEVPASEPPVQRRVISIETSLVIVEPIEFVGTTSSIDPQSAAMLDAIATSLNDRGELALIEVRVVGPPVLGSGRLALARAERIVEALIARGVPAVRLRAFGEPSSQLEPREGAEFLIR